ncbi:MAG: CPBP family intramembrane glutamic endopeptidase [Actinomycetota bacterium]
MNEGNHAPISYGAFAGIVVVYLLIIQGLGVLLSLGSDLGYAEFPDIESTLRGITIPVSLSVVFVIAIISWLGWWPDITTERPKVASWVWIVPGLLVVAAAMVTDYGNLAEQDASLILTVAGTSLLVGIGEELMFRGVSIQVLRRHGLTEANVALWSSVIFGGVHITNVIAEGPRAVFQVVIVAFAGYFFYLTYRVSGTIVAPILMHAYWDFAQFSHAAGVADPQPNVFQNIPLLFLVIAGVVVYRRRDRIEAAHPVPVPAQ